MSNNYNLRSTNQLPSEPGGPEEDSGGNLLGGNFREMTDEVTSIEGSSHGDEGSVSQPVGENGKGNTDNSLQKNPSGNSDPHPPPGKQWSN